MQLLEDLAKSLGVNLYVVGIQMAGFWILYAALKALLWKPLSDVIDRRQEDWKRSEEEIERAKEERGKLEADYAAKMAVVERQAYDRLTALVRDGVQRRSERVAKAQEEAAKSVADAQTAIRAERDRALKEAGPVVDRLAADVAARALGARG